MNINAILKKYWGFDEFRSLQQEIIQAVLDGKDTLALLPTGGGKSICFQIPALAKDGICIVVSPLIALMKDQVNNLRKKGIKAAAIFSGMNYREIDITLDNCIYGNFKFLYISPERLQTELFLERVKKMNVNLIAVDEAHCISQWGYDFRPSYLQISGIRELFPHVPVLALTATATEEVVKDIQDKLLFNKFLKNSKLPSPVSRRGGKGEVSGNVIRKSFFRPNLSYSVLQSDDKLNKLLRIILRINGSGIVYVRNRKKAQQISTYLSEHNIYSTFYHAGLDGKLRDKRQQDWAENKIKVMVCTNAFGMGIDKPDVRFVIHMDIPDSPEAYFQESGRAGRDEKKAYAIILYHKPDVDALQEQLRLSFPPIDIIKNTYRALGNFFQLAIGSGKDQTFLINLYDFCQNYQLDVLTTYNALKILERAAYLSLSDSVYMPSRIHFNASKEDLFKFQVSHSNYEIIIKTILRTYSGVFDEYIKINEADIAQKCGITIEQLNEMLTSIAKSELISYIPQSDSPRLTFLQARIGHQYLIISKDIYENRKKNYEYRINAMIKYVSTTDECRSQFLLSYFNERKTSACGICDICKEYHKDSPSNTEYAIIRERARQLLISQELSLHQLVNSMQFPGVSEKKILKAVSWLQENDAIILTSKNKFAWKI